MAMQCGGWGSLDLDGKIIRGLKFFDARTFNLIAASYHNTAVSSLYIYRRFECDKQQMYEQHNIVRDGSFTPLDGQCSHNCLQAVSMSACCSERPELHTVVCYLGLDVLYSGQL